MDQLPLWPTREILPTCLSQNLSWVIDGRGLATTATTLFLQATEYIIVVTLRGLILTGGIIIQTILTSFTCHLLITS